MSNSREKIEIATPKNSAAKIEDDSYPILAKHLANVVHRSATILKRREQSRHAKHEADFVEAKRKELAKADNVLDVLDTYLARKYTKEGFFYKTTFESLATPDQYGLTLFHYLICFGKTAELIEALSSATATAIESITKDEPIIENLKARIYSCLSVKIDTTLDPSDSTVIKERTSATALELAGQHPIDMQALMNKVFNSGHVQFALKDRLDKVIQGKTKPQAHIALKRQGFFANNQQCRESWRLAHESESRTEYRTNVIDIITPRDPDEHKLVRSHAVSGPQRQFMR